MRAARKTYLVLALISLLIATVALTGCESSLKDEQGEHKTSLPITIPEADEFGIIKAASWESQYPNQYRTFKDNDKNKWPEGKLDLLEAYPEMVVNGAGYGYAKFFTEAGGHTYSLYTVMHNGRVSAKSKTGCIGCKSAQFNADVERTGKSIYKESFWPVVKRYDEGITCANCHDNEWPGKMEITREQWKTALGDDAGDYPISAEVCGQCHCDYSMDPTTGEPTSPYDGVKTMTPEQALNWYDTNNYTDWVYPTTGAKMIAVRHSEFEYNYGGEGNYMTSIGFDCVDCHMPNETAKGGETYTSHYWQSPLDDPQFVEDNCSQCHKDLIKEVRYIQKDLDGRTHVIGERCADFIHNFENAKKTGKLTNEDKTRLRTIQREAVFYWNSVFAENSEGAHNSKLYIETLDRAEKLLDEGDKILGVTSTAQNFEKWMKTQPADLFKSKIGPENEVPK